LGRKRKEKEKERMQIHSKKMIPSFVPVHAIASMILSMCTLYTLAEYVYDDACDESMCGQEIGLSSDCVHITNISCVGDDIFSTGNGKVWEC
jgi:hypothetical protein